MKNKLLSVTIPTWNRVGLLEELLKQLVAEIIEYNLCEKIEILISNNGSEDETEKTVLKLMNKCPFITYNNNIINKGARYNVLKCLESANSEFLILLGDDDRPNKGALKKIVDFIEMYPNAGFIYDSHIFKKNPFGNEKVSLEELLENFFYYLGNAGLFIVRTEFVKTVLTKHDYNYFSPTWPQTQVLVLASTIFRNNDIHIYNFNILAQGMHEEVMIYSSYYLWRTTYFDFIQALISINNEINPVTTGAAKKYFYNNVLQLFFNILQCGVFVDEKTIRIKTGKDILSNLKLFSFKEKVFLSIAGFTLLMPIYFTRIIANLFIVCTRGKKGIKKKNEFVLKEKMKKIKNGKQTSNVVREFDFENV